MICSVQLAIVLAQVSWLGLAAAWHCAAFKLMCEMNSCSDDISVNTVLDINATTCPIAVTPCVSVVLSRRHARHCLASPRAQCWAHSCSSCTQPTSAISQMNMERTRISMPMTHNVHLRQTTGHHRRCTATRCMH